MSDIMRPISFNKLLDWIITEYRETRRIFGISEKKFFHKSSPYNILLFGDPLDTPIGPAAGPHTQLAQNIVVSYLTGSRFFELKTVQILDALEFPKPCIRAEDEGYNTEWSTELKIEDAFNEYVKAWFLLYFLQKELFDLDSRHFLFNTSVGYDLKGIQAPKVDHFLEGLKDASHTEIFKQCQEILMNRRDEFKKVDKKYIESISSDICNSITLSTMHGCPPAEIEAICKYLLREKKLHTFVKMNPTLHGYSYVRDTFDRMGYGYIEIKEESFTHDLQYADGVEMLKRLKAFAKDCRKEFGVKLSNTLPVKITREELPGEEMYMSGRALYPLTINLAYKLAFEFDGDLRISYSGGADFFNLEKIFATGIRPITVATTLLKPGGYMRFKQMANLLEAQMDSRESSQIDLHQLKQLAESAFNDKKHMKAAKVKGQKGCASLCKISKKLPLFDCFVAPCTVGCPIGQDIPEYTRLVGEERYQEALEVILAKNPLPFITGTICNHPCMNLCTRLEYDEPVLIRDMKWLAAQKGYEGYLGNLGVGYQAKMDSSELRSTSKVAIIGAGPSGLAAGYFLAKAGLDVTIMDKREKAGGTVEYVIPDFRISREAIQKDIKLIEKMGVKFEFGIQPELSIDELRAKGFNYVYLAIGAGKTNELRIEGDAQYIISAIHFLERFNRSKEQLKLGKSVAVIGGGNSAMDAARAALRVKGVEKVYIIYRRTKAQMPADREELNLAVKEGVIFKELLVPVSLTNGILKCQRMELGQLDASGRRGPMSKEGEAEEIIVDTLLSAIGEQVDYVLLRKNGIHIDEKGNIEVHPETLETNRENVYIGGDALLGPSTVVEGIAHGTKAARAIVRKEQQAWNDAWKKTITSSGEKRILQIEEKKGVLQETFIDEREATRCLECNSLCNVCTEVCPNRANVLIDVRGDGLQDTNQILHLDGLCNECGNCAVFCPYEGAPYKDKLTLFWKEEDFANSLNPGFIWLQGEGEPKFRVRLDGSISEVILNEEGQKILGEHVFAMIWTVFNKYQQYVFN